jgi:hypothetical protein
MEYGKGFTNNRMDSYYDQIKNGYIDMCFDGTLKTMLNFDVKAQYRIGDIVQWHDGKYYKLSRFIATEPIADDLASGFRVYFEGVEVIV